MRTVTFSFPDGCIATFRFIQLFIFLEIGEFPWIRWLYNLVASLQGQHIKMLLWTKKKGETENHNVLSYDVFLTMMFCFFVNNQQKKIFCYGGLRGRHIGRILSK
jgi:hypothetical protein